MKKLQSETGGLMMRLGWPNVRMLLCIFGFVLLTEWIRWLDLVPILLLIPWTVVFGGFVFLFAMVTFPFVWMQWWRGGRFRFSTRTLLLLAFIVAWPVSRLTGDARVERRRNETQQQCAEMLMQLTPAGGISMSGRYNDGQAKHAVKLWLCRIAVLGLDPNKIPYEVSEINSLDLANSGIEDDQLRLVAKTQTVSEIDLTSTKITDAGLVHLHELRSLRLLNLTNTSVSKPAIEALKKALPNLSVEQ